MNGPVVSALCHTHLSAILADLILSMTMTCLLQHIEVVSATPRAAPGVLATSTSSGPDAVATESVKIRQQKISIIQGGTYTIFIFSHIKSPWLFYFSNQTTCHIKKFSNSISLGVKNQLLMSKPIKARRGLWIWDVGKLLSVAESEMDQVREPGCVSESLSCTTKLKITWNLKQACRRNRIHKKM